MMKRFWSKLLFRDTPAQGAFFALTFWLVGNYLLVSLFFFLQVRGGFRVEWNLEPARTVWSFADLLWLFSFLFPAVCFFFMAGRALYFQRLNWQELIVFAGTPEIILLLPLVVFLFGASKWKALAGVVSVSIIFCLFLLLCFFVRRKKWAVLNAVLYAAGMFSLAASTGYGSGAWFGVPLLLLLAGYGSSAKLLSAWSGAPFRDFFGKGVLALWGMAAAVYLGFTVMAISAEHEADRRVAALERYFGRSFTPEPRDSAAAEFWERICERHGQRDFSLLAEMDPRREDPGKGFEELRRQFRLKEPALADLEQAFSGTIPVFPDRRLMDIWIWGRPDLFVIRNFLRLELLRMRFDGTSGPAVLARLRNVCRFLRSDPYFVDALDWTVAENMWLDAMELMLESGTVTVEQLKQYSEELRRREDEFDGILEEIRYREATLAMDRARRWAEGDRLLKSQNYGSPCITPRSFFLFFPQWRWWYEVDRGELADCFDVARHHMEGIYFYGKSNKLSYLLLSPARYGKSPFAALKARLRAMRGLIAAELYKREHGDYPETMTGLLIDPFSDGPLLYRRGECPWRAESLNWIQPEKMEEGNLPFPEEQPHWKREIKQTAVPAVQVWSVGPNGKNDGGNGDDIRAIRRITP